MQARYLVGAGVILGAFAVVAIVAFFANQQLYLTVDELVSDPVLYAVAEPTGVGSTEGSGGTVDRAADPEDAAEIGAGGSARRLQVRGVVDYDSVRRADEGLELRFDLTGTEGRLPVVYEGMVPDTFDSAEEITIAGHVAPGGTFVADDLVVQCPSKYEAVPPGEEGDSEGAKLSDG